MDTAARTEARSVAAADAPATGPPQWLAIYARARHQKIVAGEVEGLEAILEDSRPEGVVAP